jgi:hypothetical protein
VQARVLRRALEILGGIEAAEAHLGLPGSLLTFWLCEKGGMPNSVFLRLVDLIMEHEIAALRKRNTTEHDSPATGTDVQSAGPERGKNVT